MQAMLKEICKISGIFIGIAEKYEQKQFPAGWVTNNYS